MLWTTVRYGKRLVPRAIVGTSGVSLTDAPVAGDGVVVAFMFCAITPTTGVVRVVELCVRVVAGTKRRNRNWTAGRQGYRLAACDRPDPVHIPSRIREVTVAGPFSARCLSELSAI